jgi:hypothetical protein
LYQSPPLLRRPARNCSSLYRACSPVAQSSRKSSIVHFHLFEFGLRKKPLPADTIISTLLRFAPRARVLRLSTFDELLGRIARLECDWPVLEKVVVDLDGISEYGESSPELIS